VVGGGTALVTSIDPRCPEWIVQTVRVVALPDPDDPVAAMDL
jgi:hypothetical protein